jgi:hypothetical protein
MTSREGRRPARARQPNRRPISKSVLEIYREQRAYQPLRKSQKVFGIEPSYPAQQASVTLGSLSCGYWCLSSRFAWGSVCRYLLLSGAHFETDC